MILSATLATALASIKARQSFGLANAILLQGVPGSGKTLFAKTLVPEIGATFFRYDCRPDKERDVLYDYDVQGIVMRTGAFIKGAAWQAFEYSLNGKAILLIDEVDKAVKGFDTFLLRLIEEGEFTAPNGETIRCNLANIVFILTSNKNRNIEPALLRRVVVVNCLPPSKAELIEIIGVNIPKNIFPSTELVSVVADICCKQRLLETNQNLWATAAEAVAFIETTYLLYTHTQTKPNPLVLDSLISSILFKGITYTFEQNITAAITKRL